MNNNIIHIRINIFLFLFPFILLSCKSLVPQERCRILSLEQRDGPFILPNDMSVKPFIEEAKMCTSEMKNSLISELKKQLNITSGEGVEMLILDTNTINIERGNILRKGTPLNILAEFEMEHSFPRFLGYRIIYLRNKNHYKIMSLPSKQNALYVIKTSKKPTPLNYRIYQYNPLKGSLE